MQATTHFKQTIQNYLEHRASYDILFANSYRNPNKNIDDCVTYILNWVQKSGCNGFDDSEIYSQALHYFDEMDIDVGNPINCRVAVNHIVELTEEEKAQARVDAIKRIENDHYKKMTQKSLKTKRVETSSPSLTLF